MKLVIFIAIFAIIKLGFAGRFEVIKPGMPGYSQIQKCLPPGLQDDDKVVLRVHFGHEHNFGIPHFFNSQGNRELAGTCPMHVFGEENFAEKATALIKSHGFPLHLFDFAIVLEKTWEKNAFEYDRKNKSGKGQGRDETDGPLFEQAFCSKFNKMQRKLQAIEDLLYKKLEEESARGTDKKELQKRIDEFKKAKEGVEPWSFAERGSCGNRRTSDKIDAYKGKIQHEVERAQKLGVMARISSEEASAASTGEMVQEMQLKHFFMSIHGGKHAEDALIFSILRAINEDTNNIPIRITIYGNKDPCFECQVKLQWLAHRLSELNRGDNITEICYYSSQYVRRQCLYSQKISSASFYPGEATPFLTRPLAALGKIGTFTFKGDVSDYKPELFSANHMLTKVKHYGIIQSVHADSHCIIGNVTVDPEDKEQEDTLELDNINSFYANKVVILHFTKTEGIEEGDRIIFKANNIKTDEPPKMVISFLKTLDCFYVEGEVIKRLENTYKQLAGALNELMK